MNTVIKYASYEIRGISCLAVVILTSQEELCSVELVT
jgi:hypothetical protein